MDGAGIRRLEMKRVAKALALIVPLALSAACAHTGADPRKYAGLDRRLDPFTYIEEGKLVALAVNTQATRYREKESYIPLAVGIANKGKKTIRVDRESFILYDETGKRYPMVPFSEVNQRYERSPSDRQFTTFFEIWNAKWPVYTPVPSDFFPLRTARIVQEFIELPPFHYTAEYLYFPHPEDGLVNHRFELHVNIKPLEEPVFVKFLVD
ncbi:MAG: hypothetical protein DMF49_07630 [Acidobacteria bacterium]|nr:MAG: hypothetical protein DMF49_07630 [Acidobacteriota bacterium]